MHAGQRCDDSSDVASASYLRPRRFGIHFRDTRWRHPVSMENDIEVSSCDAIIVTGTPLVSILDDTAAGERPSPNTNRHCRQWSCQCDSRPPPPEERPRRTQGRIPAPPPGRRADGRTTTAPPKESFTTTKPPPPPPPTQSPVRPDGSRYPTSSGALGAEGGPSRPPPNPSSRSRPQQHVLRRHRRRRRRHRRGHLDVLRRRGYGFSGASRWRWRSHASRSAGSTRPSPGGRIQAARGRSSEVVAVVEVDGDDCHHRRHRRRTSGMVAVAVALPPPPPPRRRCRRRRHFPPPPPPPPCGKNRDSSFADHREFGASVDDVVSPYLARDDSPFSLIVICANRAMADAISTDVTPTSTASSAGREKFPRGTAASSRHRKEAGAFFFAGERRKREGGRWAPTPKTVLG